MSAIVEWVLSLWYLILAKLKSKPDTSPVPEPVSVKPTVIETATETTPEPITVDVTVNEADKENTVDSGESK